MDNESTVPTAEDVWNETQDLLRDEMARISDVIAEGGRPAISARLAAAMFENFQAYLKIEEVVHQTPAGEVARAVSTVFSDMIFSAAANLGQDQKTAVQAICRGVAGNLEARIARLKPVSKIIIPGNVSKKSAEKVFSEIMRTNGRTQ